METHAFSPHLQHGHRLLQSDQDVCRERHALGRGVRRVWILPSFQAEFHPQVEGGSEVGLGLREGPGGGVLEGEECLVVVGVDYVKNQVRLSPGSL